jgi:hypothetical protein
MTDSFENYFKQLRLQNYTFEKVFNALKVISTEPFLDGIYGFRFGMNQNEDIFGLDYSFWFFIRF